MHFGFAWFIGLVVILDLITVFIVLFPKLCSGYEIIIIIIIDISIIVDVTNNTRVIYSTYLKT